MASLAAAAAPAALGLSEIFGISLGSAAPARAATSPCFPAAGSKIVALFSKKAPAKSKVAATPANDELAKWYGPDRKIFLPDGLLDRSDVPEYLTGEVPGDYGYDPFGLSKKPADFAKYQAFELIHARWAMLGAAGFIIPEAFNKFGANCGPEAVWFKTGALLLDGNTLNYFGKNIPINLILAVAAEVVLVGGAEYYRITNGLARVPGDLVLYAAFVAADPNAFGQTLNPSSSIRGCSIRRNGCRKSKAESRREDSRWTCFKEPTATWACEDRLRGRSGCSKHRGGMERSERWRRGNNNFRFYEHRIKE